MEVTANSNIKVFENPLGTEIKQIEKNKYYEYAGFVYAIEYGDLIKIGCTRKPYQRLRALVKTAEYGCFAIGRVVLTIEHTNYYNNEKIVHNFFSKYRVSQTELFDIKLEDLIKTFPTLVYKDESKQIEQQSIAVCNGFKNLLFGGFLK